MRVTVLYGGPSAEREVSIVSGRSVADGLRQAGHEVLASDILPDDLSALDAPTDVVFPVLHGTWGESGELQEILERRKLPFVGSGSEASRLGMDKVATKQRWQEAGLPTPRWAVLDRADTPLPFDGPCVVKAADSGSSLDVFLFQTAQKAAEGAAQAVHKIVATHGRALVEEFISGIELTVGLLEEQPLAPIRIVPTREFFDFEAKYRSSDTEHRFDTGLGGEEIARIQKLVEKANAEVGAVDLARVDVMVDEQGQPFLLEINTLPGFTPRSLLPEAAAHDGVSFCDLVDRLVKRAADRGPRG